MTSAQPPISLFVEILDHYLAHLEAGNPLITPKYIAGLVALITEHVETMEAGEARDAVERHYANTRALIKARGSSSWTKGWYTAVGSFSLGS